MAKIYLKDAGKEKTNVLKLIRSVTSLGLKEAIELINKTSTSTKISDGIVVSRTRERTPMEKNIGVLITGGLDQERAIKLIATFKRIGATVVIGDGYKEKIIKLLIEQNKKLSVSDINALLKTKDIDGIKESCENLYNNGDIDFAGQGRYYIFSEDNKKTKSKSGTNSTFKSEIKVLLDLFKEDILTKEQFVAKIEEKLN